MCDGAARDRQRGNAESHTSEGHRVERTGESRGWCAGRERSTKGATGVDRDQRAVQAPQTEGRGFNTQRSRTGNGNGLMMIEIKIANRIAQVTKCGGIAQEEGIMNKLWKRLSQGKRRGQSMLVIVAALPVIVGSLALVLDVANLYFNQLQMQCASDSAVLAGGEYLPSYPSQAISTATTYAEKNGLLASEIVSVTVDRKSTRLNSSHMSISY